MLNRILCHHSSPDHCFSLRFFHRDVSICSRCLGLYLPVLFWLFFFIRFPVRLSPAFEKSLILFLFLPVFLDWALTGIRVIRSSNYVRLATGCIASPALARYSLLWADFVKNREVIVSATVLYLVAVFLVLVIMRQERRIDILFHPGGDTNRDKEFRGNG
ncbi:MAG: DUF2085 domain-containing protein [bacterium]|nr:DUF2085 domain-containing protein [bacterium]